MEAGYPLEGRLILRDAFGRLHTIPVMILVKGKDVLWREEARLHDYIRAISTDRPNQQHPVRESTESR